MCFGSTNKFPKATVGAAIVATATASQPKLSSPAEVKPSTEPITDVAIRVSDSLAAEYLRADRNKKGRRAVDAFSVLDDLAYIRGYGSSDRAAADEVLTRLDEYLRSYR